MQENPLLFTSSFPAKKTLSSVQPYCTQKHILPCHISVAFEEREGGEGEGEEEEGDMRGISGGYMRGYMRDVGTT